jgi:hypothetical protein
MSRRLVDGKHPKPKTKAAQQKMLEGRKPKFIVKPEILQKAEQALRIGSTIDIAFAISGISYETLRQWIIKGHEHPDSQYGALIEKIKQAMAEWEIGDLSVIQRHAFGAPAEYEMEIVRDKKGNPIMLPDGKPVMQVAKDGDGNPIIKRKAIESDWRAAIERLSRRKPKIWAKTERLDLDGVLTFDNKEREAKPAEAMTFEQKIAEAVRKLEEDV